MFNNEPGKLYLPQSERFKNFLISLLIKQFQYIGRKTREAKYEIQFIQS